MNKLNLTSAGGFPLRQDRLEFLQIEVRAMLAGIAEAFNTNTDALDGLVIHGCEIAQSGANVVATAGLVYFNGELWTAPAQTLPVVASPAYQIWNYAEELVDDPAGIKQYFNGDLIPTQKIRRAKLTHTTYGNATLYNAALAALQSAGFVVKATISADSGDWSGVKRLKHNIQGEWQEITYSSVSWRNVPGSILYKKDISGNVTISGSKLNPSVSPTSGLIGSLPAGFRPVADSIGFWTYSGAAKFIKIQPDGDILLVNDDLSNSSPAYGAVNMTFKAV
jgi:hypothetical protein